MNNNSKVKELLRALLYLFPALLIILVFHIYPVVKTLDMSFYTKFNYYKNIVFERGLDNYQYLINDSEFWIALKNTLMFVIGVVPLSIALSLIIALLLSKNSVMNKILRSVYFIPFVTSTVAISAVWRWIFHSEFGILNYLIGLVGFDKVKWLTDPKWALVSLIILCVWKGLGYNIVILLGGLKNIDQQYNNAALIDGASWWKRMIHITIPLLSPSIFFVSIMTMISSFKVFDEVYILFDKMPGPLNSCMTMVYYIYDKFANKYMYGIAAAAVYILFAIVLIFTLFQMYLGKKKVHY
ncbi:sugar ABC transporter permease [Clostridium sp. 'deep sea']|uniref:carbohydrate ABC transporter permease n=1 Tax=Clostridium sp. 'deep sea' TaxID=2779445 RepID=UPI0018965BD2|nr:sugar ABC transporter permease [Clostridium sp. 'deep sea']QOR34838.1 sugar ABC transporter permease [Clostridium sp. 'deep sea']